MYSPKIDEELIPKLYLMAKQRKIPMTRFVNELLQTALERMEKGPPQGHRRMLVGESQSDRESTNEP